MAACRVIWVSKEVSCCLHNRSCLCSVFWLSSNFYLEKGLTLYDPLSHVVNSCPVGCLQPQRLCPLVTEVAATKGSLGDRDLEKENLASTTMLWPFHYWSAWLCSALMAWMFSRGGMLEGGSNSTRIILKCYGLVWHGCKEGEEEHVGANCWKHKRCVSEISGKILWSLGKIIELKGRKKRDIKKEVASKLNLKY